MYWQLQVLIISTLCFNWILSQNVPSVEKTPFELDEYLNGTFRGNGWNGTWISDDIFLAKDVKSNVYKVIVSELRTELFLSADVFKNFSGSSYTLNSDWRYTLIRYNQKSVFRHSTTAQFTIYDIENK
ncbi:hypothetical protein ILUMI_07678 [Ignelater luminosus]|uniref:Uncharacterized protein n=1 Tax=Ignelater luminosus TaxID=2038154 RepID=A0A8K0GHS9_IGNLU|nr:hypothetical protein ILUMI_07678 [Ignelater luminosus]